MERFSIKFESRYKKISESRRFCPKLDVTVRKWTVMSESGCKWLKSDTLLRLNTNTTHKQSAKKLKETLHKIDPKFLIISFE